MSKPWAFISTLVVISVIGVGVGSSRDWSPSVDIIGSPQARSYCAGGTLELPVWISTTGGWTSATLSYAGDDANPITLFERNLYWADVTSASADVLVMPFALAHPLPDGTLLTVRLSTYATAPDSGETAPYFISTTDLNCTDGSVYDSAYRFGDVDDAPPSTAQLVDAQPASPAVTSSATPDDVAMYMSEVRFS